MNGMESFLRKILILLFGAIITFIPDKVIKAEEVSFYIYNSPNRSVSSLIDETQNIVNTYSYDSFGNVSASTETQNNNYGYDGEYKDSETNLIYLRNRYYNPELGRFITKDSFPGFIREPQSENSYQYVHNNPVNYVDPLGLVLWYADQQADTVFKPHIKEMMQSEVGRQLLKQLHDDPQKYLIHVGPSGPYSTYRAYQLGNSVYIDPKFHPTLYTDKGPKEASTTRILSHELGHLTGTKDIGPGEMENINKWEGKSNNVSNRGI